MGIVIVVIVIGASRVGEYGYIFCTKGIYCGLKAGMCQWMDGVDVGCSQGVVFVKDHGFNVAVIS